MPPLFYLPSFCRFPFLRKIWINGMLLWAFQKLYTGRHIYHFPLLTSAFILLDTLLTCQWCVCCLWCTCFASLSLPEDSWVVMAGAQPQARWCFVVTVTEWLGNPRAPSGQPKPPTVTGSQLTTAPWARAHGWSPGNWDVWLCLSHGRGRYWCTAGVWNCMKLIQGYYYLNPMFIQRPWWYCNILTSVNQYNQGTRPSALWYCKPGRYCT